jgi:hypothetical protein
MNFLQFYKHNFVNITTFISLNNIFKYLNIFIYLLLSNNRFYFFYNSIFFYKINWNTEKKINLLSNKNFFLFKFNNFFSLKFSFCYRFNDKILFKNFYLYNNLINFLKNNKNFIIKNKNFTIFNLLNLKFFFNFLNFYKNLFVFNFTFCLLCYPYFDKFFKKFNFFLANNNTQFLYKNEFTLNLRYKKNFSLLFLNTNLI